MNNDFEVLYMEYLELKKAKEKAEEVVLRNEIRDRVRREEEATKERLKELKDLSNKLDLIYLTGSY